MPLQIRRGTTAQRLSITPLVSELVYDITTKLVYVGDGVTAGGIAIDQDSSPDFPIGDLSDINLEDLAEGDILRYDGTNWVNSELSLNSLDAVTITSPANNDIIKFNGTGWVNSELSFSTLPGIELNDPEVNQVLKFNGTSWSNENEDSSFLVTALDDLSNVEITDVAVNQTLRWNGTAWENSDLLIDNAGNIVDVFSNIILNTTTGEFNGSVTGTVIGDIIGGSVFANDSTLLVDSTDGKIVGNVDTDLITISKENDDISLDFRRYVGFVGSTTATPNTSALGQINFYGQSGAGEGITGTPSASIQSFVNGTPSLGSVPTGFNFNTTNSNGDDFTIIRLQGGDGYIQLNAPVRINADVAVPDGVQWMLRQHHSSVDANNFSFYRGRGTILAPEAIQDGDDIIDIAFGGYTAFGVYGIGASMSVIVDGAVSTNVVPTKIVIRTHNGISSAERIVIDKTGALLCTQSILTSAGGIGYSTGAGGTVTQDTSKSTTVAMNKLTGEITTFSDLLEANTGVSFTLTNGLVVSTDHIIVSHISGGTLGAYNICAIAGAGNITITIRNITSSGLTESPVIKFTVIKSVVA